MNKFLYLHQDIYSIQCIQQARGAYRDIVMIDVVSYNGYWRCEFSSCGTDWQETMLEFENYCIGLMGIRMVKG